MRVVTSSLSQLCYGPFSLYRSEGFANLIRQYFTPDIMGLVLGRRSPMLTRS